MAGIGVAMAFEGTTDKEIFEAYVEHFLAPTLRPGQMSVLDNLCAQRANGCEISLR